MNSQINNKVVMISLISEQAMPNVMAPLLVKPRPEIMVCILPEDRDKPGSPDREYRRIYDGIGAALGRLLEDTGGEISLYLRERGPVSPYSFQGVEKVCREIREGYEAQGYNVVYNITGGTKLMAQAALEDARKGGCRAIYVDTEFRNLVEVYPGSGATTFEEEQLYPLDVPHYLAACGLGRQTDTKRKSVPQEFIEAAKLLATESEGPAVIDLVLDKKSQMNDICHISLADLSSSGRALFERIVTKFGEKHAFLSPKNNSLELTIDHHMYHFWWGRRWLEWYVFGELEKLAGKDDNELRYNNPWYDVRFVWDTAQAQELMKHLLVIETEGDETKISLPLNELDVTAVRGGRLLVCECKTGTNALRSEHFYKFNVIGRRLGVFADRVFVTDLPGLADPHCGDASVRRQAVRALTQDILVVGREELQSLGKKMLLAPDKSLREQKNRFGLR